MSDMPDNERTARMRAHNQRRLREYQQAIDQGLMSRERSRKIWDTGPYDVCPTCIAMQAREARIDEAFTLPDGTEVQAPPAHEDCRCTLQSRTDTELYSPPIALGTGEPGDPFRIGGREFAPAAEPPSPPSATVTKSSSVPRRRWWTRKK